MPAPPLSDFQGPDRIVVCASSFNGKPKATAWRSRDAQLALERSRLRLAVKRLGCGRAALGRNSRTFRESDHDIPQGEKTMANRTSDFRNTSRLTRSGFQSWLGGWTWMLVFAVTGTAMAQHDVHRNAVRKIAAGDVQAAESMLEPVPDDPETLYLKSWLAALREQPDEAGGGRAPCKPVCPSSVSWPDRATPFQPLRPIPNSARGRTTGRRRCCTARCWAASPIARRPSGCARPAPCRFA
jgi:hypothetical protein